MKEHEIIKFGKYEWIVLKVNEEEKNALIVMKDMLSEEMPYNVIYESITWDECTLRAYLNHNFYFTFTKEERARIVSVNNKNPDNKEWGTKGGNDTQDEIFLLSREEAELMTQEERKGKYWWWLCSPGYSQYDASGVYSDGDFGYCGGVSHSYGVRPALNLKF